MNVNVWNIKDMFSVPPGAGINKPLSRNAVSSNNSSQTDSQCLFGSQFCPENSQPGSLDFKSQANYQRNSNPNSQDSKNIRSSDDPMVKRATSQCVSEDPVPPIICLENVACLNGYADMCKSARPGNLAKRFESEPSLYQKYVSKPPLCAENKETGSFQSFGAKGKNLIEQLEENKKKAKEKYESEQLNQLIWKIYETAEELKMKLHNMEESPNLQFEPFLETVKAAFKSLKDNITSNHESMEKTVTSNCNFRQALLELESKMSLKDAEMRDLQSHLQLLLTNVDALKTQQCEKHLEMSEKFTWLSDSIKSSEDKILSEIHEINWLSKPAPDLKDSMTQTSPAGAQDLPIKQHITSQSQTVKTCLDGSIVSQSNMQSTCDGSCNRYSPQHRGNACQGDFCGIPCCVKSTSLQSTIDLEASETRRESDSRQQETQLGKSVNMEDAAVKPVCALQHFYHNHCCVPIEQDHHLPNPQKHNGKAKQLSEKITKAPKSTKAKKPGKNSKKKRTALAIKNTTQVISRAADGNTQYKSGNESVTHKWGSFAEQTQECYILYPETCESSLPVIPVPVRKARKSLKYATRSRQAVKKSAKTEISVGGSASKTECSKDCNFPTLESDHYNAECENNMLWFPPSSPPLNNTLTTQFIQMKQKSLISLLFDSSDESG